MRHFGAKRCEMLLLSWDSRKGEFKYYSSNSLRCVKADVERISGIEFHLKSFRDAFCPMNIDLKPEMMSQTSVSMGHLNTKITETSYARARNDRAVVGAHRILDKPPT